MKRCPKCQHILYHLTMTHPWRLYCPQCSIEVMETVEEAIDQEISDLIGKIVKEG